MNEVVSKILTPGQPGWAGRPARATLLPYGFALLNSFLLASAQTAPAQPSEGGAGPAVALILSSIAAVIFTLFAVVVNFLRRRK